jgi:GT2 family glycosyltransferase/glycosyltransferase involved in cell wall biosynthesis
VIKAETRGGPGSAIHASMTELQDINATPPDEGRPAFDGIICFGGVDWWYHNRGHYDLQMMRELSKRVPVLYVNSIGMRTPSVREGSMFAKRILRKLKSLRQGLVEARPNFFVFSPATLPGGAASSRLVRGMLAYQVRRAASRCGIRNPLLWIACPPAAAVIDHIEHVSLVYQRTDRFEAFHGVDQEQIAGFDRKLKARADLVLFCARELYNSERDDCRRAVFVDHGVDFEYFRDAGIAFEQHGIEPEDLRGIGRPRAGFVGGIDAHTFDPELFLEVAAQLADVQFVMVGACSLPEGWCRLPNVHLLGQRPYEEVAAYMAACDVLIMPWNQSEWIKACNPVKLKEYLAVGRPVVSTPFPEIVHYSDHVRIADTSEQFAEHIANLIVASSEPRCQRVRVQEHSWSRKAADVNVAIIHAECDLVDLGGIADPHDIDEAQSLGSGDLLSVLIVSYNTCELTLTAIRSLLANTKHPLEVIVIDNASSDGSPDAISRAYPGISLVRSSENLGFAKANNEAAKLASGNYLLLLNPDTEVLPGAIDELMRFAGEHPSAGIWGGRTVFGDHSPNPSSCWQRQTVWSLASQALGLSSMWRTSAMFNPERVHSLPTSNACEVDIVSGCLLLIKAELFKQLRGFDPDFFMYGEDADLCLRGLRVGARPIVTHRATIVHHGGASEKLADDKLVRLISAKAELIKRHFPTRSRLIGSLLLASWPLSRWIAHATLAFLGRRRSIERSKMWRNVWIRTRIGRAQASRHIQNTTARTS